MSATPTIATSLDDYMDEGGALTGLPTPEPVPDLNTYLRERRISLSRSSSRLKNYLTYMKSARRSAEVNYLPTRLDFENVSRCNFACTMCTVSEWHKGTRAADMPLEDFKRLIDEQYGLVEIKIQGLGEPTMQRDTYFEMIKYARAKNIWVRTTTNASLLHLNNNYKKLVDSGVNEIQISVDGEIFAGRARARDILPSCVAAYIDAASNADAVLRVRAERAAGDAPAKAA